MSTASVYREVAAAHAAWTCPVLLPATPLEQVRGVLDDLASAQSWPLNAFLYGEDG